MSSVYSNIECTRCHSIDCFYDYNYKTGEEYIACPDCGYQHSFFYKRDENGNFVKKNINGNVEFSNLIPEETLIDNPYGAYCIMYVNEHIERGTIETENEFLEFNNSILEKADDSIVSIKVTSFIDGEIRTILDIKNVNNLDKIQEF